jgi:glucokinase
MSQPYDYNHDDRVVMTLDAGGTSFRFSAMRANKQITDTITIPSNGDQLDVCLQSIVDGFTRVKKLCPESPVAISFAFPGPADYDSGVIGDLVNLPGFRGGVPLGPMLQDKFNIPVHINNDGDLFAYGEAIAGFLPYVNGLLQKSGSPKRYKNLLGVTLGTGFGGGIVRDGKLFTGDNSCAGEIWAVRNIVTPESGSEEGVSIRAIRRVYAAQAGIPVADAPDPKDVEKIARGEAPGNREAAQEAYRRLGMVAGNAMANALTLIDGLAVIGGGLSKAWPHFMPALMAELNGTFIAGGGDVVRRLTPVSFNLEEPGQLDQFLAGKARELPVPGSSRTIHYNYTQRIGVGISKLGTSQAIAIGAYAFALQKLS